MSESRAEKWESNLQLTSASCEKMRQSEIGSGQVSNHSLEAMDRSAPVLGLVLVCGSERSAKMMEIGRVQAQRLLTWLGNLASNDAAVDEEKTGSERLQKLTNGCCPLFAPSGT